MLTKYLQRLINGILLCSLLFHIQYSLAEPIKVVVGIGIRPPFLSVSETSGAGPEILSVLNLVQKKYHFSFLSMPSHRKAQALEKGWIHISMWDNIAWGWSNNNMLASLPLVQSKDVFIALAADDRTQQYFENIPNKSMSWVSDYHYKIADFETDIDKLAARFDLSLVRNEESAIKMVLAKRVEISIVSESALYWFIKAISKL